MDNNFDMDVDMMHGNNTTQYSQNSQGGRSGNQRACHNCHQVGHIARNCPMNQSGNGNRNNRNNNGNGNNAQQNRNGRGGTQGGQNNNRKGNQSFVDPATANPNDTCYMHPNGGHLNRECSNPRNRFSSRNAGNQNQNGNQNNGGHRQQQQQQWAPAGPNESQNGSQKKRGRNARAADMQQQDSQAAPYLNRHSNIRNRQNPLPTENLDYCERCNSRNPGHTATYCPQSPPIRTVCVLCHHKGHSILDCKHPLACTNCRQTGHSRDTCRNEPALETKFAPSPYEIELRRKEREENRRELLAKVARGERVVPPSKTLDSTANSRRTSMSNDSMMTEELTPEQQAKRERQRREAIMAKCAHSSTMYAFHSLNYEILEGEKYFAALDKSDLDNIVPAHVPQTSLLRRFFRSVVRNNAFAQAADRVRAGCRFFRDPRTMESIVRGLEPRCLGCRGWGMVLDATFTRVKPGDDVLVLGDWREWGVSVMFGCHCCCERGYSFESSEGQRN